MIKFHTQKSIYSLKFFKTDIKEPSPYLKSFLITILHLVEPGSCFILKCRIFISFFMEKNIDSHKFLYTFFLNSLFASPSLICYDELTKLSSPVTKMIDSFYLISKFIEYLIERITYKCGSKMSNMEVFSNIRRGVVYTYSLSISFI